MQAFFPSPACWAVVLQDIEALEPRLHAAYRALVVLYTIPLLSANSGVCKIKSAGETIATLLLIQVHLSIMHFRMAFQS
jgi:hypothetical protein